MDTHVYLTESLTGTLGPRELGGSVDLIKQCKLWPHHEFFCKRLLPVEISETRYLHNVVGEAKIEKGEGMELDQLFQNASAVENRHPDLQPFDMGILSEAFKMRETTYADLSYVRIVQLIFVYGS